VLYGMCRKLPHGKVKAFARFTASRRAIASTLFTASIVEAEHEEVGRWQPSDGS